MTTRDRGLQPREAERVGALAQAIGHRTHRVFGHRDDVGQDHDADDDAGNQQIEADSPGMKTWKIGVRKNRAK